MKKTTTRKITEKGRKTLAIRKTQPAKAAAGKTCDITSNIVTKIEGHAKLNVKMEKGKVSDVRLDIFETPRYFENIVKGLDYNSLQTVTSRICGVCGFVHGLAALHAAEDAYSVEVTEQTKSLRDVLHTCVIGQSHALHLGFLSLSDYLGADSIFDVAKERPELIKSVFELRRSFTQAMDTIGGRPIHMVTTVPGGFTRIITDSERNNIVKQLKQGYRHAEALYDFYNARVPEYYSPTVYMALKGEYITGHEKYKTLVRHDSINNEDKETEYRGFERLVKEFVVPYSTARFSKSEGEAYTLGALARLNINRARLTGMAKDKLKTSSVKFPNYSPFANNHAQAIELFYCLEKAVDILENLKLKNEKPVPVSGGNKGMGIGVIEAPRGVLFHRYKFDDKGRAVEGDVIPPTSQFLYNIEVDIKKMLPKLMDTCDSKKITAEIEKLIRAYDPCVSCASHFLEIEYEEVK